MNKYIVTYGGRYQRTTIHLTEVFDFLSSGKSYLNLSGEKLATYRKELSIKRVERKLGYLEYVEMETHNGIIVKYFEDGLYTFEKITEDVGKAREELINYCKDKFEPAIKYIFSLGAPIPKVWQILKLCIQLLYV